MTSEKSVSFQKIKEEQVTTPKGVGFIKHQQRHLPHTLSYHLFYGFFYAIILYGSILNIRFDPIDNFIRKFFGYVIQYLYPKQGESCGIALLFVLAPYRDTQQFFSQVHTFCRGFKTSTGNEAMTSDETIGECFIVNWKKGNIIFLTISCSFFAEKMKMMLINVLDFILI